MTGRDRPRRGASRLGRTLALVLSGLCAIALRAAEVPDLYEAEVPVATQDAADREAALGFALRRVLSKVSGQRDVDDSRILLAAALQAPEPFVQEYQYRSRPVPEAEGAPDRELRLWARFDAGQVDSLMAEAGLPVWGRTRPSTLVWLAVEHAGHHELPAAEDAAGYLAALELGARRRGIPLVLPLLDLEDRLAVSAEELWAGFLERLRQASARYDSDAVLLVRLHRLRPELSEAYWSLLADGAEQHWTTQDDLPELLLEEGMHRTADLLAARYARPGDRHESGRIDVAVNGVNTLEDYARVLGYLESLDEVERLDVDRVEAGQVRFRLRVRGGRALIRQTLALGAVLVPEGFPVAGDALELRLQP